MVPKQEVHHRLECLPPAQCDACGSAVEMGDENSIRHQVFELPAIEPIVSECVCLRGICTGCAHYAVQFSRLLGACQVIMTVSSAEKAALALAAGADVAINYRTENVVDRVLEETQGEGVDRVIEMDIAANAAIDMEVVRPNGQWVVYGSGAKQFTLPFFPMISRNFGVRFLSSIT